jgi:hypothetical protein
MHRIGYKRAALALVYSGVASMSVQAQRVTGHTRDAASGAPVSGVVVALMDSAGKTLARTISGADGEYRLIGDGSTALIRALRIGFGPTSHDFSHAAADANVTVELQLATLPMVLDTIAVRSQKQCPSRADGAAAFALWDQARDALLASVVAREAKPASLRVLLYNRAFERSTERIVQLIVADTVFTAAQPLVSVRSEAEYQSLGFMDDDSTRRVQRFYLPVAEVLLDSSFVENHCLSVKRDDSHHAEELGLVFEPANAKDSIVDVSGVIWITRTNPEIRSLEFAYTRVPANMSTTHPGGSFEYRTLPNGIVMSTKWHAHIPEFGPTSVRIGQRVVGTGRALVATHDIGGIVAEASWPDGSIWRDSLGTIRGHVIAPENRAPVGGVALNLVGTTFSTSSDSTGAFVFPSTLKGPYRIAATDTLFAAFGVRSSDTTDIDLGDVAPRDLQVKLPSRAKLARTVCAAATKDDPSINGGDYLLLGHVLTVAGTPANDAFVNVQWPVMEGGHQRFVRSVVKSDSLGRFEFCGLPVAARLLLNASRETLVSSEKAMVLDTARHVAEVALTLTHADLAVLPAYRKRKVIVTDAYVFKPLADVDVIDIFDDATLGKTDANGALSLASIPGGMTFLRLRKLGYEQQIARYAVDSSDSKDVRVQLRSVAQLTGVKVTAAAVVSQRALSDGLEDRIKQGTGHFAMPKDFDKEGGNSISALVSRLGVRLVSRGASTVMSGGHASSGYCPVTVYIDGILWWQPAPNLPPPNVYDFQADDFAAAEYYASAAEIPAQYNPTRPSPCGTLLLWRRDS